MRMPSTLLTRSLCKRTTRLSLASASFALLSSVAVVSAQSELPDGRPLVAPGLSVTPTIFSTSGYDTNSMRTAASGGGQENYIAPQIEGSLDRGQFQIAFQGALSFQNDSETSTWNHFYAGTFNRNGGLFGLGGRAAHRNHYAPPTDFVGFELGIRSRRVENTFEGEIRLQPVEHRFNASFTAKRLGLRYDADQRFRGSSLQFNLNRDTTIWSTKVGWAATPLTTVTAAANFSSDKFLFVQGSDGRGRTLMLGLQTRPLGMMTWNAQWGQLKYTDVTSGRSMSVPTFDVALAVARGQSTLTVDGSRDITFSFNAGSGFYVQTGLETYLSLKLGESLEPFVRYQLRLVRPQDPTAGDAFTGVQRLKAGLAFRLGEIRFGPEVEKYEYRGPDGFGGWRAICFIILGSPRLLRLDRPLIGEW
jgi:hypothetical protein